MHEEMITLHHLRDWYGNVKQKRNNKQQSALAVHNCVLASQSPLTGSCSGVQSKTKRNCRVPNGVFMSRETVLLAARLLLCRPARSSSVAVAKTVTYGQVGDQSWSATQPVRARSKGRTTHPATTEDHVTILNGPRTTTPAQFVHKIRTAPQRETTLRFKMATAPPGHPRISAPADH